MTGRRARGTSTTTRRPARVAGAVLVLTGFDEESLAQGVGWYPEGSRPGETGNVVLAGHRVSNGAPFARFPEAESPV